MQRKYFNNATISQTKHSSDTCKHETIYLLAKFVFKSDERARFQLRFAKVELVEMQTRVRVCKIYGRWRRGRPCVTKLYVECWGDSTWPQQQTLCTAVLPTPAASVAGERDGGGKLWRIGGAVTQHHSSEHTFIYRTSHWWWQPHAASHTQSLLLQNFPSFSCNFPLFYSTQWHKNMVSTLSPLFHSVSTPSETDRIL